MPVEEVYTNPPAKPADVPVRIYGNPICPYVQRIRLITRAKQIPHDVVEVHLKHKPTWFVEEINPSTGQVPVIEHEGHLIRESPIAFDYLDGLFGGESLWPSDPYKQAVARTLVSDFGNQFVSNYYKCYGKANDEKSNAAMVKFVQVMEQHITKSGGKFIMGEQISAVDFLLWPWMERLEVFAEFLGLNNLVNPQKQPIFYGWVARMHEVEAVKATVLPAEAHLTFLKSLMSTGKHDYSQVDKSGEGIKIYVSKPSE